MATKHSDKRDETYYDAGQADEGQYKRHVRLCRRNTTPRFESIDGLASTQDSSEEQTLSQKSANGAPVQEKIARDVR
jgi:hypothetical protein